MMKSVNIPINGLFIFALPIPYQSHPTSYQNLNPTTQAKKETPLRRTDTLLTYQTIQLYHL